MNHHTNDQIFKEEKMEKMYHMFKNKDLLYSKNKCGLWPRQTGLYYITHSFPSSDNVPEFQKI